MTPAKDKTGLERLRVKEIENSLTLSRLAWWALVR